MLLSSYNLQSKHGYFVNTGGFFGSETQSSVLKAKAYFFLVLNGTPH